jgi:hypothetical protein
MLFSEYSRLDDEMMMVFCGDGVFFLYSYVYTREGPKPFINGHVSNFPVPSV